MAEDIKKPAVEEEGAPAVVGQLSVSNDLLDFSQFASKKTKKCEKSACSANAELTPRERAILERKQKKEEQK
ncbi:hypothetical protein [[Mycoplasma] gypis]|uniref:Uncharacterized protein n=1 Tax=[Mycoplasma] gypis TaxID=92404 RepID=A0ABZ2RNA1_9BACT|nr:hypothetical protein [[Mycoplasma] gypis]